MPQLVLRDILLIRIAEPSVPYGHVARLVDIARSTGALNVVMITEGMRRRARGESPALTGGR